MQLTPHEQERLLLSYGAEVARRRRGRGLRLNHPLIGGGTGPRRGPTAWGEELR